MFERFALAVIYTVKTKSESLFKNFRENNN